MLLTMEFSKNTTGSNSAFYSTLCTVCKSSENLKRCSKCKMISYCCLEHQKKHWSTHKQICTAIYNAVTIGGLSLPGQDRQICMTVYDYFPNKVWTDQITALMSVIEMSMQRQLDANERSMVMFPRSCRVCRDMDYGKLSSCSVCHSVSYCSKEHRKKDFDRHSNDCPHLTFSFHISQFLYETVDSGNLILPDLYFPPRTSYNCLPINIHSYMNPQHKECNSMKDKILRAIGYGGHSNPLTLLYALEKIDFPIDRKSLSVHVVGADLEESIRFPCWEDVLHWLPDLEELNLFLIGPNAAAFYESRVAPLCDNCHQLNKSLRVTVHTSLYHNYYQSKSFIKPDIVVAYNCGFNEFEGANNDTWLPTLPLLASPWLVFTSFNLQDAERDVRCMKNACNNAVELLFEAENPFRNTHPFREFESDTVFFQNYYLIVLKMK